VQECQLRENRVDDQYLDQDPGFEVRAKNTAGCDITTLEECESARDALDSKVETVKQIEDVNFPKGCYRQKNTSYRFLHTESSYLWYFNNATEGQSESESEPVCKGKAKLSCLCTYISFWDARLDILVFFGIDLRLS